MYRQIDQSSNRIDLFPDEKESINLFCSALLCCAVLCCVVLCCAVLSIRATGINGECYCFSSIQSTGLEDGSCYFSYSSSFQTLLSNESFSYSQIPFCLESLLLTWSSFISISVITLLRPTERSQCSNRNDMRFDLSLIINTLNVDYPWSLFHDQIGPISSFHPCGGLVGLCPTSYPTTII